MKKRRTLKIKINDYELKKYPLEKCNMDSFWETLLKPQKINKNIYKN